MPWFQLQLLLGFVFFVPLSFSKSSKIIWVFLKSERFSKGHCWVRPSLSSPEVQGLNLKILRELNSIFNAENLGWTLNKLEHSLKNMLSLKDLKLQSILIYKSQSCCKINVPFPVKVTDFPIKTGGAFLSTKHQLRENGSVAWWDTQGAVRPQMQV